jgi:hypothetical protein
MPFLDHRNTWTSEQTLIVTTFHSTVKLPLISFERQMETQLQKLHNVILAILCMLKAFNTGSVLEEKEC